MKALLVLIAVFLALASSKTKAVHVPQDQAPMIYYFVGGIWDFRPKPIKMALEEMEAFFEEEIDDYDFEIMHNRHWENACEEIKELDPDRPLILIGQSWGAQAVLQIGHCVGDQRDIQAAVLFDFVVKSWSRVKTTASDNIQQILLSYQREDIAFQGKKCVQRHDGSKRGIECHYQKARQTWQAHDWMVYDFLTQTRLVQDFILDRLGDMIL